MTRNPSVIILLAVLFVLGGLTSSLALDLDSVLQNHDPRFDEGISQLSESPPAQNTAKPASSTLTLQEINDLIQQITKILEEIFKIIPQEPAVNGPNDKKDAEKEAVKDPKTGGGTYTIVSGDTLWAIAKRFLGSGNRYWEIVEANKDKYPSIVKNPNLIYPGWTLIIPGSSGQQPPATPPSNTNNPTNPDLASPTPTPTPTPTVPPPAAGAKGGKALLGWLQAAGLSGENLKMAWAIGMGESGGNPRAFNGNANTGDKSYGLFQINMINRLGPARLKQYGLKSNEDLFDPATNVRVMIKMSKNCTNWSPWSVFKHGTYKKYLSQYPLK